MTYRTAGRDDELDAAGVARRDLSPEIDLDLVRDAAYQARARELRCARGRPSAPQSAIRPRPRGGRPDRGDLDARASGSSGRRTAAWRCPSRAAARCAVTTADGPGHDDPALRGRGLVLDPETGEALPTSRPSPRAGSSPTRTSGARPPRRSAPRPADHPDEEGARGPAGRHQAERDRRAQPHRRDRGLALLRHRLPGQADRLRLPADQGLPQVHGPATASSAAWSCPTTASPKPEQPF